MDVASDEIDPEASAYFSENLPKLNPDQSVAFDTIKSKITCDGKFLSSVQLMSYKILEQEVPQQ